MKILVKLLVFCVLSKVYQCIPRPKIEWGVPRRRINDLLVGGVNAYAQDFPWHATLFHKDETSSNLWNYACGGCLISQRFVLTAKHCTEEYTKKSLPVEKLLIKFGLQMYNETNKNTQSRQVKKVYYPKGNLWEEMRNDIALVELTEEIEITNYVLPVLIVDQEPAVGKKGTVAGFGFTENHQTSLMLKRLAMPVVDSRRCLKRHDGFKLDMDQFCAGHIDNRTACNGDSGSGLVFRINRKFYLGGLVSYSELDYDTYSCRFDGYSVFTNVYYYVPWINRITKLNVSLANYPEPNDQTCGVSKVRRFRRIVGGQKAVPGQWPWHVKIYSEYRGSNFFCCGGTLLSAKFIITDGNMFKSQVQLLVQLGASKFDEPNRDFYNVEKLYIPQGEKYAEYEIEITVLQLSNEVVIIYTDFVRPVCLPKADIKIGAFGTAIGFGFTEERKWSTDLRMVQLPTIDSTRCRQVYSNTNYTFCAGIYNRTSVCNGDIGGGMHFKGHNGEWYIGGVTIRNSCSLLQHALFANVFKYLPWIQSLINSNS